MSDDVKPRGAEVESTVAAGAGGGNGGGVGAVGVRSPPMGGEGWVWGVEGWTGSTALAAVEGAGAAGAMSVGAGARRSSPDDPVDAAVGGASGVAARGVSPCRTADRTGVSAGMTSSPDGAASAGVVASAGSGGICASSGSASADASRIGSAPVPGKRPGGANRDVRPSWAGGVGMGSEESGASSAAGRVG